MKQYGVLVDNPRIDWAAMQKQKDTVVSGLTKGIEGLLKVQQMDCMFRSKSVEGGRYKRGSSRMAPELWRLGERGMHVTVCMRVRAQATTTAQPVYFIHIFRTVNYHSTANRSIVLRADVPGELNLT